MGDEKREVKRKGKHRMTVAIAATGSIALLLALGSLGYSKLRSRTVPPTRWVVLHPVMENKPSATLAVTPTVTTPVASPAPTATVPANPLHAQSEMMHKQLTAPSRIPNDLKMVAGRAAPPSSSFGAAGVDEYLS
jgi:hypothetical protein